MKDEERHLKGWIDFDEERHVHVFSRELSRLLYGISGAMLLVIIAIGQLGPEAVDDSNALLIALIAAVVAVGACAAGGFIMSSPYRSSSRRLSLSWWVGSMGAVAAWVGIGAFVTHLNSAAGVVTFATLFVAYVLSMIVRAFSVPVDNDEDDVDEGPDPEASGEVEVSSSSDERIGQPTDHDERSTSPEHPAGDIE